MPLQSFMIDETLRSGLRRFGRPVRDSLQLVTCNNLKPLDDGLAPAEAIVDPFDGASMSYPYPQLIKHRSGMLSLTATTLSTVNTSSFPWAATSVTTYDFYSTATPKAIPSGSRWQIADMGKSIMLFNGSCQLIYMPEAADYGDKWYVQDAVDVECGAYHRGRVVFGGLSESSFWSDSWKTYIETLAEEQIDGSDFSLESGTNWVFWSSIGGGDVLWPFNRNLAMTGTIADGYHTEDDDTPLELENWKIGTWGFMALPFRGTIRAMLPLGQHLIVYADDGVVALTLVSQPTSTYGVIELADHGIFHRAAVAGDEKKHIFLDESGHLWVLTADLQKERLVYSEFFGGMTAANMVISHDTLDDEFYITDGSSSYVLTPQGLGRIYQAPTCIVNQRTSPIARGDPIGLFIDTGLARTGVIKTDLFDLGSREQKTVKTVGVGAVVPAEGITATLEYRSNVDAALKSVAGVAVQEDGIALLDRSGSEFQLELTIASQVSGAVHNTEIDALRIVFEQDGKSNVFSKLTEL